MRLVFFAFLFLFITSCAHKNETYWCGDHPCINNKEREAYFKKTLIVEIKNLKNVDENTNSEIEKIIQQAQINKKKRIKNEKILKKEVKLEKRRKSKEEKFLVKQAKIEQKRLKKNEKLLKSKKKKKKIDVYASLDSINASVQFEDLVKKIIKRNETRPFPNINNNQ